MNIIEHPLELDENIIALLKGVDGLDFSQYRQLSKPDLIKIFKTDLNWIKERDYDPKMFLVLGHRIPSALITIENLNWDTSIFGIRMGRLIHVYLGPEFATRNRELSVVLNHILREFAKRKIQHISLKTSADDWFMIRTLQEMGFMLMDTLVDYSIDVKKTERRDVQADFKIRFMKEEDANDVIGLCREVYSSYKFDRFHREPLFRDEQSTNLYVEWIRNQIYTDAEEITVAEADGMIVGFSSLQFYRRINREISVGLADIAIAGVAQENRGRNIYPAMLLNHIGYAKERNIALIKTTTHVNNIAVHKALTKVGFSPSYVRHTFHKAVW